MHFRLAISLATVLISSALEVRRLLKGRRLSEAQRILEEIRYA